MIRRCFFNCPCLAQMLVKPHGRARLVALVFFLLTPSTFLLTRAATLPAGFSETMIANGLSSPTAMDFAPDGRLFVCLQGGQ
ncbi:MAG: hypothetical protein ACXW18_07990, partial [Pyrinomonadaceae bacterium]